MKRLLLPLALVVVVAACAGGSTTSPTSTPTPGLPVVWEGSVRFTETRARPTAGSSTRSFEGAVTWQKDETPGPDLPAGSVQYAISQSRIRVTYHADGQYAHSELDTCTADGEVEVELQPYHGPFVESLADEFPSTLIVGRDGEYRGEIHSEATVSLTRVCPGGSGRFTVKPDMHLYLKGRLVNGRRMQGEMPPDHFADTTLAGSWDFAGR